MFPIIHLYIIQNIGSSHFSNLFRIVQCNASEMNNECSKIVSHTPYIVFSFSISKFIQFHIQSIKFMSTETFEIRYIEMKN